MTIKTDKLLVSVYAKHGDTCGLTDRYGHHDTLGCASGYKENDYVLVARFAYFQEGLEYAKAIGERGVHSRVISRLASEPYITDYPKEYPVTFHGSTLNA